MIDTDNDERALARIVIVDDVLPHTNADRLELAIIGGWQCVIKKGEFQKGDIGLYCEIDSLLPLSVPEFTFLQDRKNDLKAVGVVTYARIKSTNIRKELAQGLLVPVPKVITKPKVGMDVTKELGVLKYEKPSERGTVVYEPVEPTWFQNLSNKIRAGIPDTLMLPHPEFLSKTKQRRVQNISNHYAEAVAAGEVFEKSVKMNGESFTAYNTETKSGLCNRNNEISLKDINWTFTQSLRYWLSRFVSALPSTFAERRLYIPRWKTGVYAADDKFISVWTDLAIDERLQEYAKSTGLYIAIQGELCGPGHQSNKEGLEVCDVYFFQVEVIKDLSGLFSPGYMKPADARRVISHLGLEYVPVLDKNALLPPSMKDVLKEANGPAYFNKTCLREGVVFKSNSSDLSFKVVSNKFLLKNEDE